MYSANAGATCPGDGVTSRLDHCLPTLWMCDWAPGLSDCYVPVENDADLAAMLELDADVEWQNAQQRRTDLPDEPAGAIDSAA